MHWKGQGRGLSGELKDITSQRSINTEGMLHRNNVFGCSYTDELNISVIQLILTPETEKKPVNGSTTGSDRQNKDTCASL